MNKILSLLLVFVLCLSLWACGNTAESNNDIEKIQELTPWVFGEWYSNYPMYFAEAPLMVINADGTCTYQGKHATWTVSESTDIHEMESALVLHFENNEKYHFILDKVNDFYIDVIFQDMNHPEIVGGHALISREGMDAAKQNAESLVGEWIDVLDMANPANGETFMEIRGDGTCAALGEEGLWGLLDDGDMLDYIYIKTADRTLGIQLNPLFESGFRSIYIHDLDKSEVIKVCEWAVNANDIQTLPGPDTTVQATEPAEEVSPADEVLAILNQQMDGYKKIVKRQSYEWQPGLQVAFLGAVYENDCIYVDVEFSCDENANLERRQQEFGSRRYFVYDEKEWTWSSYGNIYTCIDDPGKSVYTINNGEVVHCRTEIFNCAAEGIALDRINQFFWRFELNWNIPDGGSKYYIDISEWLQ